MGGSKHPLKSLSHLPGTYHGLKNNMAEALGATLGAGGLGVGIASLSIQLFEGAIECM
jgi:hypothetical protein